MEAPNDDKSEPRERELIRLRLIEMRKEFDQSRYEFADAPIQRIMWSDSQIKAFRRAMTSRKERALLKALDFALTQESREITAVERAVAGIERWLPARVGKEEGGDLIERAGRRLEEGKRPWMVRLWVMGSMVILQWNGLRERCAAFARWLSSRK